MVTTDKYFKNAGEIKQNAKNLHECPFCGERVVIGVEIDTLQKLHDASKFPYAHLHIHGDPLHGLLCYIDAHLTIRTINVIKSLEISRDSDTFRQLMKKWSNPY